MKQSAIAKEIQDSKKGASGISRDGAIYSAAGSLMLLHILNGKREYAAGMCDGKKLWQNKKTTPNRTTMNIKIY